MVRWRGNCVGREKELSHGKKNSLSTMPEPLQAPKVFRET